MSLVAIIRPHIGPLDTRFAVHRAGCIDLVNERRIYSAGLESTVNVDEGVPPSRDALAQWLAGYLYSGGDVEWRLLDLTIYPCTRNAQEAQHG